MEDSSFRPGPLLEATLHGIGLVAAAWCLSDLATGDRLPLYRDLLPFVYPYRAFLAEHLARGEVPLWNPFIQFGVPFLASLHASVFYPLSLFLLVPLPLGFNLFLLAHFAVAWVGATVWLRREGASLAGGLAGAVVFTIGGYLAASVTNTAHLQAAVWTPWILYAWRGAFGRTGGAFLVTVLLLAIQLLAGAPEIWLSTVGLVGAWTLFAAPAGARERAVGVARFGACLVLVIGVAAFQLLPTFEYLMASRRAVPLPYGEITYWSMSPVSLLQLVFPPSTALVGEAERGTLGALLAPRLPLVHSIYLGIAGLCLAAAAIGKGRERAFWVLVAAFGVLLSLGTDSPLYGFLLFLAPDLLGRIRYPEKFLFVFHVGAVALVARGATAALRGEREALRTSGIVAGTLGLVALGLSLVAWLAPGQLPRIAAVLGGHGDWPREAFVPAGIDLAYKAERALWLFVAWGVLIALRLRGRLGTGVFHVLVVLLLAGDLASANRGLWLSIPVADLEGVAPSLDVEALRASRRRIFHFDTTSGEASVPGLLRRLPPIDEHTDLRNLAIEGHRTLFYATGMLHGVGNVAGADSISTQPVFDEVLARVPRESAVDLLGRFGVEVLVGPTALSVANVERLDSGEGDSFLYRVRTALPFAYLVSGLEVIEGETATLLRLAHPSFPSGRHGIVEAVPDRWRNLDATVGGEDSVVLRSAEADSLELEVQAAASRLLIVNQAFFPGWRAGVDGSSVPIVRANGLVQGIVVPPGRHLVRLDYRPAAFRLGVATSLATFAVLAIGGLWLRSRCG